MRRIVLGMLILGAACSSQRSMSPAPPPQKSALLQCRWNGVGKDPCGPKPLLLIDGKRASWDGSDLVPSEIESVEVLKGQTALRMYGPDALYGVVQITTKKLLKF